MRQHYVLNLTTCMQCFYGPRWNLVYTFLLPLKCHNCIWTINKMFLSSSQQSSSQNMQIYGTCKAGQPTLWFYVGAVHNVAVSLLGVTASIVKFVKGIFVMELSKLSVEKSVKNSFETALPKASRMPWNVKDFRKPLPKSIILWTPFWVKFAWETTHETDITKFLHREVYALLHWARHTRIRYDGAQQHAIHKFQRACTLWVGVFDCLWFEEERSTTLLYRLRNAKLLDCTVIEAYLTIERVSGLVWRSVHTGYVRRQRKTFAYWDWQLQQEPNATHVISWTVHISESSVKYEKHTKCVPTSIGHQTVDRPVASWACILWCSRHSSNIRLGAFKKYTESIWVIVESLAVFRRNQKTAFS